MSETANAAPEPAKPTEGEAASTEAPKEVAETAPEDTRPDIAEARKYRKRAQEAETERDALRDRLTGMQRAEVERLAGQRLADGADIWHDNDELAALLDDTGLVDPEKVTNRVKEILNARPHWKKPAAATESTSTVRSNDIIGDVHTTGFIDAFKPRNQR